jgi:hypothetical protein
MEGANGGSGIINAMSIESLSPIPEPATAQLVLLSLLLLRKRK